MSYFMSPQTHPGLPPSSQGERGLLELEGVLQLPLRTCFLALGEVEVLLGIFGLDLESLLLEESYSRSSCQ